MAGIQAPFSAHDIVLAASDNSFVAKIKEYSDILDWQLKKLDTTYQGIQNDVANNLEWRTSIPSTYVDPGDLEFDIFYSPAYTLFKGTKNYTLTFPLVPPGTTAAYFSFTGYIYNMKVKGKEDDLVMATVKLAISGKPTYTDQV